MKLADMLTSPWAIIPSKLLELQAIYRTHLRGEKIDVAAIEAKLGRPLQNKPQGYEVRNNVAVIPIEGVISKRMNLFSQISGGASTELVGRDIRAALADPAVHALVLDIDSPGGSVDGTMELAELVYASRNQKPIVTFASGVMASAAYWVGCAASKVFISSNTTAVGSIGVVLAHVDYSRREEQMGIKTTEIFAGRFKRIASEHQPLSEDGREYLQNMIDHLYSVFVADVAKQRGVDTETVLQNMADGRIFTGVQAVRAGLVDGVSSLDSLINSYGSGTGTPSKTATNANATNLELEFAKLEKEMTMKKSTNANELTDEALRREWNADADLRAEFCGDFSVYAAYKRAEASGRTHRTGGAVTRIN